MIFSTCVKCSHRDPIRNILSMIIIRIIKINTKVLIAMIVLMTDENGLFARYGATIELYITIDTVETVVKNKVFFFFGQNQVNW